VEQFLLTLLPWARGRSYGMFWVYNFFIFYFFFFFTILEPFVVYRVKGDDLNKPPTASEWYWV
jgi:hypothetical protein